MTASFARTRLESTRRDRTEERQNKERFASVSKHRNYNYTGNQQSANHQNRRQSSGRQSGWKQSRARAGSAGRRNYLSGLRIVKLPCRGIVDSARAWNQTGRLQSEIDFGARFRRIGDSRKQIGEIQSGR